MSNGRRYRRRHRIGEDGPGGRCGGLPPRAVPAPGALRSLAEWEDDPTCPSCGPIDRLSTGWLSDGDAADVLCCPGCWTPLVRF